MNLFEILSSKPHNIHYLNRYIKFIEHCKNNTLDTEEYKENHHICPKAKDMFPEYKSIKHFSWNNVRLTDRQHFIAHRLLWKIYNNSSQSHAFKCMTDNQTSKNLQRKKKTLNSKTYSALKNDNKNYQSKRMKGMASYRDLENNSIICSTSDPRVLNGELISTSKGRKIIWGFRTDEKIKKYKLSIIDRFWSIYPERKIEIYFLDIRIILKYTRGMPELIPYLDQGWGFNITPEFKAKRAAIVNINRFEKKINNMIYNHDYSKFEYLIDIKNNILVHGVYSSLKREYPGVFQRYCSNRNFRTYKDILTGKIHQIDSSIFPIPFNFKLYNTKSKLLES